MGLYDREYAQEPQQGIHLQPPQSITVRLVLINVCVYLVQIFMEDFSNWFVLEADWFKSPWKVYCLLSYGFLHDTKGIQHILFNMIMLWMFGREIESLYGRRQFLLFYLWAIVFAGLFWSLSEMSMGRGDASMLGASGGISALFVLFAMHYPHRQVLLFFVIPMPMWLVALFFVGQDIYGSIYRTSNIAFTAHLAGAVAGLYFYKFKFSPFAWIADRFSGAKVRRRPNLRLHEPDYEEDLSEDPRQEEILRKINEQGMDSLTDSERRYLERASERYRRNRS